MNWFNTLSIRSKMVTIILTISLIVLGLVSTARIAWDVQQGREALILELTTLNQLLGDRSSAALAFEDQQLAIENLSSLQSMPNIIEACLYRSDDTVLAHYKRDTTVISNCSIKKNKSSKAYVFGEKRLNANYDIQQGKLTLGWIYISSDFSQIQSRLQEQLFFTVFAIFISIFICIFLANWAQRLISNPILEITKIANAIEEQVDHSLRVNVSGDDEITRLALSFNAMLDALEIKNEQLRRSQKMDALGKLTGGIAHDFNNMLGVVLGYSDLLNNMLENNPKAQKYTKQIIHASERGAKLTQKLLAFSRNKHADAGLVDLNELLYEQQHMLEKTLTVRVSLVYKLTDSVYPIWIDSNDLEDAILNMCINSMHAIKDSGTLTIETNNVYINDVDSNNFQLTAGDYAVLTVSDTGTGMDKNVLNNIFDPFYSTKGDKGTGLGLSQVYGFTQSSGGTIKVYSELNQGTRFTLYFPRHYNEATSLDNEDNEYIQQEGNGECILVVDDEPSMRSLTSEILTTHGYNVKQAKDAEQALSILDKHHIDLMFTDVIMPNMDGYELATRVRQTHPSVKIQLASGFTDDRHINMIDSEIHKNLIHKPYSSQALLKAIFNTLK